MDAYNESQRLLKALKKDKYIWQGKLVNVKVKDEEISNNEKSLQESLNVALLRQQVLGAEVLKLTDKVVSILVSTLSVPKNRFLPLSPTRYEQDELP